MSDQGVGDQILTDPSAPANLQNWVEETNYFTAAIKWTDGP